MQNCGMKIKYQEFCENLDKNKISNLHSEVQTKLNDIESVVKNDINNYVERISDIFQNAAQKTFKAKMYNTNQKQNDKKWF